MIPYLCSLFLSLVGYPFCSSIASFINQPTLHSLKTNIIMSEPRDLSLESIEEEKSLVSQIQIFLEASDEVEMDIETVDDLMQALSQAQVSEGTANGASSDQQNGPELSSQGKNPNLHICIFTYARTGPAWTMQEVKAMLRHLKERGQCSFGGGIYSNYLSYGRLVFLHQGVCPRKRHRYPSPSGSTRC